MKEKQCSNCKQIKPLSEFNKRKSSKDGYQYRCKLCHAVHNKKHYKANKELYIERASQFRKELNEWYQTLKASKSCSVCGESRHWRLAFHHVDPKTKISDVCSLVHNTQSKQTILDEIEKCIVLCHNCHSDIHHAEHTGP